MKRIVIVSELFYPDGTSTAHLLTKIADRLAEDYEVRVIAGPETYSSDNIADDTYCEKNYPIDRVSIGNYDKNKLPSRVAKFVVTSFRLGSKLSHIAKSGDEVLIVTNPAPFLVLVSIIKRFKKFHTTILVHDVFPENLVAAGIVGSLDNPAIKALKAVFRKAYLSADRIITIGRDMKDLFEEKCRGAKHRPVISVIENWADKNDHPQGTKTVENGKIRLLYAGNIGRCQGLESFFSVFHNAHNPGIELKLRGGGALVDILRKKIEEEQISGIEIGEPFSRHEQFEILADCDIAIVTLSDGMLGLGVPSKTYNIMAAGKPIVFVGDLRSEIALMVRENNIGYCFDSRDPEALCNWLSSLGTGMAEELREMGLRARRLAETTYSEEEILSRYTGLFAE